MKIKYLTALIFFNFAILQSSEQLNQNLITATRNGQLEHIIGLITQGADVNAKNNYNYTALMSAAQKGHTATVKYLTEHGADVNAKNGGNLTALIFAAYEGHIETVRYLTENGADVNAIDSYGYTALINAVERGHTKIVEYLAQHGANINAENNYGKTALDQAAWHNHTDIIKYLIEHGIDITTINELTAQVKRKQEELEQIGITYKSYKTVHNYLEKISIIQHYLKDALVEEQITQEPDLDQYFNNHSQLNELLSKDETCETMREDTEEITEEERQLQRDEKKFGTIIERFMTDQSAYWKGRVREAIHPLREQKVHPLRNLLTEINPGLLPQIISYFKNREMFKNLITEKLLPTATELQRTRLEQIVQAEEQVDAEKYAPDAGPVLREAIAQKIKEEMASKQKEQASAKAL